MALIGKEPLVVHVGSSVVSPAVSGSVGPRDEILTLIEKVVLQQRGTIQVIRGQAVQLSR